MNTPMKDKLLASMNADDRHRQESSNKEPGYKAEQYMDTPVYLHKQNDTELFATLGTYKITPTFTNYDALISYIHTTNINLIMSISTAVAHNLIKNVDKFDQMQEQENP